MIACIIASNRSSTAASVPIIALANIKEGECETYAGKKNDSGEPRLQESMNDLKKHRRKMLDEGGEKTKKKQTAGDNEGERAHL